MQLDVTGVAREHGVADLVTYLPHLDQEALALLYAGADAFVLPTTYEGISQTMFEAMASGTAVLTVEHPTLEEGAGDTVLALRTPSVVELVDGMRRLLEDEQLRESLVKHGRSRAREFSWTATARSTVEILDGVAHSQGSAGVRPARWRMTGERGVVADYWDEHATRYDADFVDSGSDGHALQARLAATLRRLGAGPGELLDAGMGPGRLCQELDRRSWTVSGVDVSRSMVQLARDKVPNAAERFLVGEIEHLPFGEASFDAVVATGVLEYSQVPEALAELARVLRPDGHAVVSYPNPYALYGVWKTAIFYPAVRLIKRVRHRPGDRLPTGSRAIPPARMLRLLDCAGLSPTALEYTSVLPLVSPLELLFPRVARALGSRLEGRFLRIQPLLATQVLFSARKR